MRKSLVLLLTLILLCPFSAAAAEGPKYIALTFEGFPAGQEGLALLEGLEVRGARATFFLWDTSHAQTARIAAGDHELGLLGHPDLNHMSRRKIAGALTAARRQMPEDQRVRLFRPGGACSDGICQVARVTGLTILDWSQDPEVWAFQDSAAIGRPLSQRIEDGDVIRISLEEGYPVPSVLALVELLGKEGFRFVTVSELAQLRTVQLQPGKRYDCFPSRSSSL